MELPKEMQDLLHELKTILENEPLPWVQMEMPTNPDDARGFQAQQPQGWSFIVVDFDITSQGFPPGSRGHDGTAHHVSRGLIMRLTRELSAYAFGKAIGQLVGLLPSPPTPPNKKENHE